MEYASRGVANTGLGLGIAGTALGLLNGGGGILSGFGCGTSTAADLATVAKTVADMTGVTNRCSENTPVTRYEMDMAMKIAERDNTISLLRSEQNTEVKIADVYARIMEKVNANQKEQADWNAAQSVANAQMSAAIATNANSIAALQNCCSQITKLVVPNTAICPGWGPVQITPEPVTTTVA